MILTHHGIDSLRNGKIIYEFDAKNFNLDTLRDGPSIWKNGSRALDIRIIDDYLSVIFTSGQKQYFTLLSEFDNVYLNQLDEFFLEIVYTGNFYFNTFFGPWTFSFSSSNPNTYNFIWKCYNNSWSSVGSGNSFSISDVYKYHFVKKGTNFDVELFKNDTKILNSKCDNFGASFLTHNVDYNGNSHSAQINLHKLKIYLP